MKDSDGDKKTKLGIFISTNLQVGAGVERVAFQMISDVPKDFRIYLIQTDFFDGKRMSNSDYNDVKEKCVVVTLKGFGFISILREFGLFTPLLVQLVAKILRFKNRKVLTSIGRLDAIYLTSNWWAGLFSRETRTIIGSSHIDFGFGEDDFISSLKAKLIKSGLIFRHFSAFHTFPGMESMSKYIDNKIIGVFPPMGVDSARYFPRPLSEEINILFVARLVDCKGPFIAIDAFKDAISKIPNSVRVFLTIVGSGPLSEEIKRETNENIKYCGPVDAGVLEELYGKSDIFLAPTSCDTFSIVTMESLASGGHAIISSLLKGRFDDFVNKGYAEYAEPNIQSFSRAIEYCLADIAGIRYKRGGLRSFFMQRYDSHVVNEKIFDWIKKLTKLE